MVELSQSSLRWLIDVWVVLVGAVVGSFLNVVIARVPHGESIVRPRSRCPHCKALIRWYDNVPVLSWILLRARCRSCGGRISARYPLVEALGAGAAWFAWHRHGLTPAAPAEFAFVAALLALSFIDLDTWLLPNAITWPLIAFGLLMNALGWSAAGTFRQSLYGAGVGFLAFALVHWVGKRVFKKDALGFGDVWLLAGLGAWLGVKALLPMVLLGSLEGSVISIVLMLAGKAPGERAPAAAKSKEGQGEGQEGGQAGEDEDDWVPDPHHVPFGPFLALGAIQWLYLGAWFVSWFPTFEVFR